jgi:uncharacterized membrane protein
METKKKQPPYKPKKKAPGFFNPFFFRPNEGYVKTEVPKAKKELIIMTSSNLIQVKIGKAVLLFTPEEYTNGLKRGKAIRRSEEQSKRSAAKYENKINP